MTLAELEAKLVARLEEVAPLHEMKRSAAYAAAKRGEIPTVRLGRKLLVPVPALLKMLGAEPLNGRGVRPSDASEAVDGSSTAANGSSSNKAETPA